MFKLLIFLTVCFYVKTSNANENEIIQDPREGLIAHSYATRSLCSEKIFILPIKPEDAEPLLPVFTNSDTMKYFGDGKTYSTEEVFQSTKRQSDRTLLNKDFFTWTLYTHEGIVGRIHIWRTENRLELSFCVIPTQGGKNLARRGSELVMQYFGAQFEEERWIATAHPLNMASRKTLESIRYPNDTFVFYMDSTRIGVEAYGQVRNYYLSIKK